MPGCSCGTDYDALFNDAAARRELDAYRRRGPGGDTRRLIEAIVREGVESAAVLDIGGGVGAIGHELMAAGAASVVDVDASRAYVEAARSEAERRGHADRATYRYADFVAVAAEVEPADVVTLDRVICCYGDMPALVGASVSRARRLYGLIYPMDRWWTRIGGLLINVVLTVFRQRFRFHVHATARVDSLVRSAGFRPILVERGLLWQTILYRRVPA